MKNAHEPIRLSARRGPNYETFKMSKRHNAVRLSPVCLRADQKQGRSENQCKQTQSENYKNYFHLHVELASRPQRERADRMLPAGPRGGACCTAGQKAEPPRRFFLFLFGKRGARAGNPLLLSRSRFGSIRAASRKSPARACAPKDRGLTLVLISRCH